MERGNCSGVSERQAGGFAVLTLRTVQDQRREHVISRCGTRCRAAAGSAGGRCNNGRHGRGNISGRCVAATFHRERIRQRRSPSAGSRRKGATGVDAISSFSTSQHRGQQERREVSIVWRKAKASRAAVVEGERRELNQNCVHVLGDEYCWQVHSTTPRCMRT